MNLEEGVSASRTFRGRAHLRSTVSARQDMSGVSGSHIPVQEAHSLLSHFDRLRPLLLIHYYAEAGYDHPVLSMHAAVELIVAGTSDLLTPRAESPTLLECDQYPIDRHHARGSGQDTIRQVSGPCPLDY